MGQKAFLLGEIYHLQLTGPSPTILSHTDVAFVWNNDNNKNLTATTFLCGFNALITVLQAFECIISFRFETGSCAHPPAP